MPNLVRVVIRPKYCDSFLISSDDIKSACGVCFKAYNKTIYNPTCFIGIFKNTVLMWFGYRPNGFVLVTIFSIFIVILYSDIIMS